MRRWGRTRRRMALALTMAATGTNGCSTQAYGGRRLPDKQVAFVSGETAQVVSVDGRKLPEFRWHDVTVLPGQHRIGLRLHWSNRHEELFEVPLTTAARHSYAFYAGEQLDRKLSPSEEAVTVAATVAFVGVLFFTLPFSGIAIVVGDAVLPRPPQRPHGRHLSITVHEFPGGALVGEWTLDGNDQANGPEPQPRSGVSSSTR